MELVTVYDHSFDFAKSQDEKDVLSGFRDQFYLPKDKDGKELIYFCGNSLGLQPKRTASYIQQELEDWSALGVEGHFRAKIEVDDSTNGAADQSLNLL